MEKSISCFSCGECNLHINIVSLNKKLLGRQIEKFYCLDCLARYLEVTSEELLEKIEEFKAQGCQLFK